MVVSLAFAIEAANALPLSSFAVVKNPVKSLSFDAITLASTQSIKIVGIRRNFQELSFGDKLSSIHSPTSRKKP